MPLLQEYFYDDFEKIKAILGDNGFITSKNIKVLRSSFSFCSRKYFLCQGLLLLWVAVL